MSQSASIKKRHHYLSKFYLDGFCDQNNRVWTYRKIDPTNPYPNKPTDTSLISKLYHLSNNQDGINDIEDYFSDEIEAPASNAFKILLENKFPNDSEREKLSLFFGTLMVRTPSYINHMNIEQSKQIDIIAKFNAQNKKHFYDSYKINYPDTDDQIIENNRQFIINNDYSFNLNRDIVLKLMINFGTKLADLLCNMQWALIKTTSDLPFITSDNFINIYHPNYQPSNFYQPGLGISNIRVFIPISHESALLLINNTSFKDGSIFDVINPPFSSRGNKVDLKKIIQVLNKSTYIKCYEYTFANSNSDKLKRCFGNILDNAKLLEQIKNYDNDIND